MNKYEIQEQFAILEEKIAKLYEHINNLEADLAEHKRDNDYALDCIDSEITDIKNDLQ